MLGFWSSISSCGAALLSSYLADRLVGNFKAALLILLGTSSLLFIWMGLICMGAIPFSMGIRDSCMGELGLLRDLLTQKCVQKKGY
jgi:hypothetical protein